MRIALVSPYSWTYPGGVTRHIEALAGAVPRRGPRRSRALAGRSRRPPRRAHASRRAAVGPRAARLARPARADGRLPVQRRGLQRRRTRRAASARCAASCAAAATTSSTCTSPSRPFSCWDTLCARRRAARRDVSLLLGERRLQQRRERHGRAPAAQPAARADRGVRGRGLDGPALLRRALPDHPQRRRRARRPRSRAARARAAGEPLRIAFVGQAVERKGLPVLLRAFEALREHMPVELHVVGVGAEEIAPLHDRRPRRHRARQVHDADKRRVLERADMLCAPSLGGESFGMVLTEAFAAGTPVVASDIAGYRDVVTRRRRRRARPARRRDGAGRGRCATSRSTPRAATRSRAPRASRRSATPGRGSPREVLEAYEDAIAMPAPEGSRARCAWASRHRPAPPRRLGVPARPGPAGCSLPGRYPWRNPAAGTAIGALPSASSVASTSAASATTCPAIFGACSRSQILGPVRAPGSVRGDLGAIDRDHPDLTIPAAEHNRSTWANSR